MQFSVNKKKKRAVNMTSLVDVVFLLLIFFMLTTSFISQRGIGIEIPQSEGKKSSWQGAILIRPSIDTVLINTKKVPITEVTETLSAFIKDNGNPKVIIQPYKNVPLQSTVVVLDQVRQLGVTQISMMP